MPRFENLAIHAKECTEKLTSPDFKQVFNTEEVL